MKKLYLDYNVISYLRKNIIPDLNAVYDVAKKSHMTVFSPAHLEDIAVSEMRDCINIVVIRAEIDFLSSIAQRNGLRPVTRDNVILYDESPEECYKRVKKYYSNNTYAEVVDAFIIKDAHENPAGSPREANNIPPDKILHHINYREVIALVLYNNKIIGRSEMVESLRWSFDDIKSRFSVFEAYVNIAANILEKLGYYREPEENSRSRLHDVSHIIYSAYCDVFVSADKRIRKKALAIYSLLQIPTQVLSCEEFIAMHKIGDNSSPDK